MYVGDFFVRREFCQSAQRLVIPLADILCYSPGTDVEPNASFRTLAAAAFNSHRKSSLSKRIPVLCSLRSDTAAVRGRATEPCGRGLEAV